MERQEENLYSKVATCLFDDLNIGIEKQISFCKIDHNLVLQLSNMDLRGRSFLLQHASDFLTLNIDSIAMAKTLNKWLSTREDNDLEDQFLLLQAPQKLMRELFGMHADTFSWRRKLLGLSGEGRHRPSECKRDTEVQIWKYWHKYKNLDERERYLKVVELSNRSISVISAAIKRYNEAAIDRS